MRTFRVGVFSDSHGDQKALYDLMEKMGYLDAVCFLGDVSKDAMFLSDLCSGMPQQPAFYGVRGNNDLASMLPDSMIADLGGVRAYLTHGHLCAGPLALAYRALENECSVALFGHTHIPFYSYEQGVLLLNPGSAGNYCRGGAARASVLEITGGKFRVIDVHL
ncbi:MAG: metallophosphoesterase [Clostridia bacterium]|nr:metallophosphoesterase [Clostridia bacterium]